MTQFNALYSFIRSAIGDVGIVPLISNSTLDLYIANGLQDDMAWRLNNDRTYYYTEVSPVPVGGRAITPDWQDPRDVPMVFYTAALVAVAPSRSNVGHRAGHIEVRRGGGTWDMVTYLEKMQRRSRYADFNVQGWTEWYAQWLKGTPGGIALLTSYPG